jgi:hypothetical protein
MEALAAFGVASNVVQFIDFATKFCATSATTTTQGGQYRSLEVAKC